MWWISQSTNIATIYVYIFKKYENSKKILSLSALCVCVKLLRISLLWRTVVDHVYAYCPLQKKSVSLWFIHHIFMSQVKLRKFLSLSLSLSLSNCCWVLLVIWCVWCTTYVYNDHEHVYVLPSKKKSVSLVHSSYFHKSTERALRVVARAFCKGVKRWVWGCGTQFFFSCILPAHNLHPR